MDVIDSLVVTLGLDPSQYNNEIKKFRDDQKRMQEEQKKANRDQEDAQKRAVDGIRNLRNETAGFLLMLAGANSIKDFAANIIQGDAATGRLANNLGLATEQVGAWEGAIKRVGGTAADIDGALRSMSSAFQSLQLTGTTGKDADFQGLGVSSRDLQNPQEALLKISEASTRMNKPEFNARLSRIGFDQNTINLLGKGRAEVSRLLEEQRKLGVTTDANAEAAQKFQDRMATLESAITGKARPAIEGITLDFAEWLNQGDHLNDMMNIGIGILGALAVAAGVAYAPFLALAGGIALVASNLDTLRSSWEAFDNWWKEVSSKADPVFDPIRKALGFPTGAEMAANNEWGDNTGVIGSPFASNASQPAGGRATPAQVGAGGRAVALNGNNPGGIQDGEFARSQPGYVGANGRYAAFSSLEAGEAAQKALLLSYVRRGIDTPSAIAQRWAPRGDGNDPVAYAASIARRMGIGVNDKIGLRQINAFQLSQAMAENSAYGRMRPGANVRVGGGGSTSQTTSVGQVNIYTQATDAAGIARDFRSEMAKRGVVNQANTGLEF